MSRRNVLSPFTPTRAEILGSVWVKGIPLKLQINKIGDAAEQQCTVDLQADASLFVPGLIAGP